MSATLGGLIKDYRLQKNISQLEIAFALGWKETSRLSRIEQGRVGNPSRELLDRLSDIMKLEENERGTLFLAGGYLPTEKETVQMRISCDSLVQQWEYPLYVLDFSWRLLHWNKALARVYHMTVEDQENIKKYKPRTIDLIFDPNFFPYRYLKGEELKKWHEFLLHKLVLFKSSQMRFKRERWYIDFVKKMMGNDLFRTLWSQAKVSQKEKGLSNYERKSLVDMDNPTKNLEFHIFDVPLMQDPRYVISIHTPANVETMKYFQK